MFGDISLDEIDNFKETDEVSENITNSTAGRDGMRYLDRVLKQVDGRTYILQYRVRSAKLGSFIFDTFGEAAEYYNQH
jgi:hypothetical protein